uniref:Uncharacterized protein n=1 Tax=Rhizophora mucronata TaxID=61149 RepID=A0A2P2LLT5_RHIMU
MFFLQSCASTLQDWRFSVFIFLFNATYCLGTFQVRDAKIRVLGSLKQDNDEECLEWKTLSSSLKVKS